MLLVSILHGGLLNYTVDILTFLYLYTIPFIFTSSLWPFSPADQVHRGEPPFFLIQTSSMLLKIFGPASSGAGNNTSQAEVGIDTDKLVECPTPI
jgi:hypothetical protein